MIVCQEDKDPDLSQKYNMDIDPIALEIVIREKVGNNSSYAMISAVIDDCVSSFSLHIKDSHINQANQIRNYYKHKMLHKMLKGEHLSNFQHALYEIVNKDLPKQVTYDELRILSKLSDFYKEDKDYEVIEKRFKNYTKINNGKIFHLNNEKIQYIKNIERISKTEKSKRYWFNTENNILLCILLDLNNPLECLLKREVAHDKLLTVNATCYPGVIPGRDIKFYQLGEWKIV